MSSSYYGTKAWRDLRAAVLRRDPICATRGCGRPSSHADHVIPRSRGGADSMGNLRGMCSRCHNSRSARGNAEPRAIGCDANGQPRDPGHPWLDTPQVRDAFGEETNLPREPSINAVENGGNGDTPSKDGRLEGNHRRGSAVSTKFPNQ